MAGMGIADEIRAAKSAVARDQNDQLTSMWSVIEALDAIGGEVGQACREERVRADGADLLFRGQWCFDVVPGGSKFTVCSNGKWFWGHPMHREIQQHVAASWRSSTVYTAGSLRRLITADLTKRVTEHARR